MRDKNEIFDLIRRKNEKIIKRGTYVIDMGQPAVEKSMDFYGEDTYEEPVEFAETGDSLQDDLVNEILQRFKNNIQDNVSALFENS